ncbi:MAG: AAA family ATPase [Bryobacteraceae bacterium]
MPTATRTFRVFVSSTFEDLKEERDALQREVFPKLRTLCERHGARFHAIDLRWGVRDEAALDQKTMEICLREIERCQRTGIKPNFIVLLGQRYGWRPLPSRVEAGEFEAVLERIEDGEDRALAENWYRRDDNAVPPECLLKARVGESAQSERWQLLEAHLHRILRDAAQAAGLSDEARVKFEASATHQEIMKGLGATAEDRRHVFAFCRNASDRDCDPDLVDLKRALHARLPTSNIVDFAPGDFAKLCQDFERTLRAVIESEAAGFESRPALALETEAHDAFARSRALVFGRDEVLEAIASYVRADDNRPLVLHGASGTGKSAVMGQASERARAALASAFVVRRFIGASPESSSGLTLLRSLSEQIGAEYVALVSELPTDFNGVARAFRDRLGLAKPERPLVIFIDALDQLGEDDPARSLDWLAGILPAHCRLVLSTTDLVPALKECTSLKLDALPEPDAAQALDHWLKGAARQLQPGQRQRLLTAFTRCGLPLYLKLAFEEACGWASHLALEECLLGDGVGGVVDTLLNRLSLDANHGPLLVGRTLAYLAAARYGLTEDEMLDVLSADEQVWRDFERRAHHAPPERRLPVIVLSRLLLDLESYLTERSTPGGTVTTFYHRQLAEQSAARFLAGEDGRLQHRSLALYFGGRPQGPRQLDELPWQWQESAEWQNLADLLADSNVFDALWKKSEFEVKAYWTRIQSESPLRLEQVYAATINAPTQDVNHARRIGVLLADTGNPEGALRVTGALVEHFRKQNDHVKLADALGNMALVLKDRGDLDRATALNEEAQILYRELGNMGGLSRTLGRQAVILKDRGDLDGAMALYKEEERLDRELGDNKGLSRTLGNQAVILQYRGDLDGAMALHKEEEHLDRELGDKEGVSRTLGNQAVILQYRGDLDGALVLLQEAERLCRELGNKQTLQVLLGNQGLILRARGDINGAIARLEESERLCRELGNKHGLQRVLGNRALILRAIEDLDGALAVLKEQEHLCRELGNPEGTAACMANQAWVLSSKPGHTREARRLADKALAMAAQYGYQQLIPQFQNVRDSIPLGEE